MDLAANLPLKLMYVTSSEMTKDAYLHHYGYFFFLEVLCFSTKFYVICSSVVYHTEAVPVLVGTAYDITSELRLHSTYLSRWWKALQSTTRITPGRLPRYHY